MVPFARRIDGHIRLNDPGNSGSFTPTRSEIDIHREQRRGSPRVGSVYDDQPTAKDDDVRHAALTRFVQELSAADGLSVEALAVEGVKFLKRLEVE